jgi:hypothetical protein
MNAKQFSIFPLKMVYNFRALISSGKELWQAPISKEPKQIVKPTVNKVF